MASPARPAPPSPPAAVPRAQPRDIVLAASLWGSKPEYGQGALRLARAVLPVLRRYYRCRLVLYHDATVPAATLVRLRETPYVELRAAGHLRWKGDRRAMWRFQALADFDRVLLIDTDLRSPLLVGPLTRAMLDRLRATHSPTVSHLWTFAPGWRHAGHRCIPAGLTAVYVPSRVRAELQRALPPALRHYARKQPVLDSSSNPAKADRYRRGYGLDEWFLTFRLPALLPGLVCAIVSVSCAGHVRFTALSPASH